MIPQNHANPQVTVYSQPGCGPCRALTRFLETRGVPHRVIDITTDPAAADRLRDLGMLTTPVTEVDGVLVSGFRPDRLSELLEIPPSARPAGAA